MGQCALGLVQGPAAGGWAVGLTQVEQGDPGPGGVLRGAMPDAETPGCGESDARVGDLLRGDAVVLQLGGREGLEGHQHLGSPP